MSSPPRSSRILFAVSLILTLVFSAWAMQTRSAGTLQAFDEDLARSFKEAAEGHHRRREIMIGITHAGGVPAMVILALVGVVWQWRRGDKALVLAWALIPASGGLIDLALKKTLDRPRPPAEWRDEAVSETNESFPSGHSMGSLIGYGLLAFAALPHLRRREAQFALLTLLLVIVGLIGFSRIYLRAHWFSDVIGGFTIGAAWLAFCLAWVTWLKARSAKPQAANP